MPAAQPRSGGSQPACPSCSHTCRAHSPRWAGPAGVGSLWAGPRGLRGPGRHRGTLRSGERRVGAERLPWSDPRCPCSLSRLGWLSSASPGVSGRTASTHRVRTDRPVTSKSLEGSCAPSPATPTGPSSVCCEGTSWEVLPARKAMGLHTLRCHLISTVETGQGSELRVYCDSWEGMAATEAAHQPGEGSMQATSVPTREGGHCPVLTSLLAMVSAAPHRWAHAEGG